MNDLLDNVDRLREILVGRGAATLQQIESALWVRKAMQRPDGTFPRLGEVLVRQGVMPDEGTILRLVNPPSDPSTLQKFPRGFTSTLPPEVAAKANDPAAQLGKYILVEEVGRGASGVVFRAWDRYLSQTVALKLLMRRQSRTGDTIIPSDDVEEFLREARTAVRLRHPNIVRVYEVGCVDGRYFISMDFVDGKTLDDRIQELFSSNAVPWRGDPARLLQVLIDVSLAIHEAHTHAPPIVHRDLKPGNILIDGEGRAFVVDFGLACEVQVDDPDSGLGIVRGTPSYMAPEQASGRSEEIDARTDVYGLGAILYKTLCGRPPFESSSIPSLLYQAATLSPDPPSAKVDGLSRCPSDLEDICIKAMARDKAGRYGSAKEFAEALIRTRKGKNPIPGAPRRVGRVTLAAAAGCVLAAGLLVAAHRSQPPPEPPPIPSAAPVPDDAPRREWEASLQALRADPMGPALDDLAARIPVASAFRREVEESWKWAQPALATLLVDRARSLSGAGPSSTWLDPAVKDEARRILARMEAYEGLGRGLDAPFDGPLRFDEGRAALRRLEGWQGLWHLKINAAPFAHAVLVQDGREVDLGWTPLGLNDLEVGAGTADVILFWPSRENPQVRLVQELSGLREGQVVRISGRVDEGRLSVRR